MPSSTSFHVGILHNFLLFSPSGCGLGRRVCVPPGVCVYMLMEISLYFLVSSPGQGAHGKVRLGSHRKTMKIGFVTLLTFADSLLRLSPWRWLFIARHVIVAVFIWQLARSRSQHTATPPPETTHYQQLLLLMASSIIA